MKKALSLLLAIALILALAIPAFAAEATETPKGSITLTGVHEGQTYKVYEMLHLMSYSVNNDGTKNYNYVIIADSPWLAFFQSDAYSGSRWVNLSELKTDGALGTQYYDVILQKVDGAVSAEQLALDAITYAKANNITPDASEVIGQVKSHTFQNLHLGYYLIDSTVGALCCLTNVDPDEEVAVKNDPPVPEKVVQENSTSAWGEKNDIWIGGTVNFQTTFVKEAGAQNYKVHDFMDDGLTLNENSFKLVYTAPGGSEIEIDPSHYTISFQAACTDTKLAAGRVCDFEIEFKNDFMRSLTIGSVVKITYSAVLNEDAVVDGANHNETYMTYGDENATTHDFTDTYTWYFGLFKYRLDASGNEKALPGAKFCIYASEPVWDNAGNITNNVQAMPFIYLGDLDTPVSATETVKVPTYRIASMAEQEAGTGLVTEFVTTDIGYLKFIGLDSGDFFVREIEAPAGYTIVEGLMRIDIFNDGAVSVNNTPFPGTYVKILNTTGAELPETGGTGTTLLYVLGATLMLGALVLLITKRRVSAN